MTRKQPDEIEREALCRRRLCADYVVMPRWPLIGAQILTLMLCLVSIVQGQSLPPRPAMLIEQGDPVPRDVREIYDKGLQYLASAQNENGSWMGDYQGAGTTGMAMMAFLASGEDPNFGIYRSQIRKAVQYIVESQDTTTGYYGGSMYHHGFALLAIAEAYGVVDERNLWSGKPLSIGKSLEMGVRCAVTSQRKNAIGAWRYSPDSNDADTSVSGAILVGLLAARNAGIEVPDESIDKGVRYFTSMTSSSGQVAYSGIGGGGSTARIAIASLVYSIARRKDLDQYKSTTNYLTRNLGMDENHYQEYGWYYQAQALFQGDMEAWEKWNTNLLRRLKNSQQSDGSFTGSFGPTVSTSLSLLALALNYRFLPIYER